MEHVDLVSEKIKEIQALRKKANDMEDALRLLFGNDVMGFKKETKQDIPNIVIASANELSGTFLNKINTILSNVEEMKAKELHGYFPEMPSNSFSARLSTLVKQGKIKKRIIENASNSDKFFYHLG